MENTNIEDPSRGFGFGSSSNNVVLVNNFDDPDPVYEAIKAMTTPLEREVTDPSHLTHTEQEFIDEVLGVFAGFKTERLVIIAKALFRKVFDLLKKDGGSNPLWGMAQQNLDLVNCSLKLISDDPTVCKSESERQSINAKLTNYSKLVEENHNLVSRLNKIREII